MLEWSLNDLCTKNTVLLANKIILAAFIMNHPLFPVSSELLRILWCTRSSTRPRWWTRCWRRPRWWMVDLIPSPRLHITIEYIIWEPWTVNCFFLLCFLLCDEWLGILNVFADEEALEEKVCPCRCCGHIFKNNNVNNQTYEKITELEKLSTGGASITFSDSFCLWNWTIPQSFIWLTDSDSGILERHSV